MTPKEYIQKLKDQGIEKAKVQAITTVSGPLLVIAGPGSGKTMTLVERVVYLVLSGVEPKSIMVSTFTEKAAKELITRVSNRLLELNLKVNLNEMYIGTLHSIFLRFLEEFREHTRLRRNYRVLDDFDQQYFIYRNLNEYLEIEGVEILVGNHLVPRWDKCQSIIYYVSKVREECLDEDKLILSDDEGIRAIGFVSKLYGIQLGEENALDFSTIQTEALHLLESNTEIREKLQKSIQYIMVDEFQDTNTIQERILLKLSEMYRNICVVGDDDQGLYRFRGATVRNILEFPDNFFDKECKQISLSTNYRSHPGIIDFYNNWMYIGDWKENGKNFRYPKTIIPQKKKFPDYPSVVKVSSDGDQMDYFEEVFEFITGLEEKGIITDRNQIAFLFRSVKNDNVIELAN
ncbi:MAG TPA: UvrD-helicase domain-containing protein, partial [Bacteroidia bacterium]|nr:UvrD-helicase domain-containing protein [Bacteroidia bacterium]